MLRLFAIQRRNTATILRSRLPAVASQNLCNTLKTNPRDNCRYLSDNTESGPPVGAFPSTGHYHIWSLISNTGESLMTCKQTSVSEVEIQFSGSYDDSHAVAIDVINSTTIPQPTNSFLLQAAAGGKKYLLSVEKQNGEYVVVMKPAKKTISDNERFIPHRHGSYSMFESKVYKDVFLGSDSAGNVEFFEFHDLRHPDTRVLLMLHLKKASKPQSDKVTSL